MASAECPGGMTNIGQPNHAAEGKPNTESPEAQAEKFLGGDYPNTTQKIIFDVDGARDVAYEEVDGTRRAVLRYWNNEELGWHIIGMSYC